ncbi:MAG: cation transporter [Deltaproteobacteria bacterium]|nr:cation transporter [Deltaproteobacteria bacterium]
MHHKHNHLGGSLDLGGRLIAAMALNILIPAVQIYGGIISGSMALISDALHNISDFSSLLISYAALRIGRRGASYSHTFGYKKFEVLAALVNVALLYGASAYIAYESWRRLMEGPQVRGGVVIWVAIIGLVANALSALFLRQDARENMNIRSAFLHLVADAIVSLSVVILGIVWLFKPWYWLDAVFSWIIVVVVLASSWEILSHAFSILMDATPRDMNVLEIQRALEEHEGIVAVHHIHLWKTAPDAVSIAAHIIVPDQMLSSVDTLSTDLRRFLEERFGINHSLFQFETTCAEDQGILCNQHENNHGRRSP